MTEPNTDPEGRTPSAPDVDQPDGGAHDGTGGPDDTGRTPSSPAVEQPEAGTQGG